MKWRVGRKLGRTIYLQQGEEPSDNDRFLGIMDREEDARLVVIAVERFFDDWQAPAIGQTWQARDSDLPDLSIQDVRTDGKYVTSKASGGYKVISALDLNVDYELVLK